MATYAPVHMLNNDDYVVVDLDTGTVLGTNLKAIKVSDLGMFNLEDLLSSDSIAVETAEVIGLPMLVETTPAGQEG